MRHRHLRLLASLPLAFLVTGCPAKDGGGGVSECPAPVGTVEDLDGDLLTNVQEAALGSDPEDADTDGDGFGDYVEYKAGTGVLDDASAPSGQVASVRAITSESELIGGPAAQGQVGDWLLENDRIRAIVQRTGVEQMQVGKFGGNLIDADVIRTTGPGMDRVGSVVPIIALGHTSNPVEAVVVNDGSDGGPAILRTCGPEMPFEYLDVAATVSAYGLSLRYDTNADLDVYISNDYVLAPGSDSIEVITTVANDGPTFVAPIGTILDSGGAEEVFLTNYQGFGALDFASLLAAQPPVRYMAYLGRDANWGIVSAAEPNAAINVFGITAIIPGFSSPIAALNSDPEDGPGGGLVEFKKGKRFSWRRAIVITDGTGGTDPISAEYLDRHEPGAGIHSGTVADDDGPVAGARVVALRRGGPHDRAPVAVTESDALGDYSFHLAPGDYYIAADVPGRDFPIYSSGQVTIDTLVDATTIPAAEVTVSGATALPDITFESASAVQVTVTEAGTGAPVPAKLSVVGSDPSPGDSIFRDQKDRLMNDVAAALNSGDGTFLLPLEPGDYTLYASRGIEWSLAESPITVTAGATTSAAMSIGRAVDTPGWISADLHVHMLNSPDSPVTLADRTLSGAAEGLDVIVTTDHDFLTDLTPLIGSLGLQDRVASCVGEEISTTAFGHFISFPLTIDSSSTTGGSYAWSGPAGAFNARAPADMFTDIDTAHPGPQVAIVAHPRGDELTAYYDAVDLDTITLQTKRDPLEIRIPVPDGATPDDTKLFYTGFDAQEVQNGADASAETRDTYLNDFFSLLSHGLTLTAVGSSDTHSIYRSQLGFPRTFAAIADDDPAAFGQQAQEAFATALKEGRSFFTTGPILDVTVTGDDAGGPGDLVLPRTSDGEVTVEVRLSMPEWVEVDTLRIYMNTPNTGAPAEAVVSTPPVPYASIPIALTTTSAGFGILRNVDTIETDVTVPANGDAWLVVTATVTQGGTRTLYPVVPQGSNAFAMASPVYLDGNRNGAWNAPGNVTAGSFTARPDVRTFTKEEIDARVPDFREQFQRLTEQGHNH